jgi:hypothetical protein
VAGGGLGLDQWSAPVGGTVGGFGPAGQVGAMTSAGGGMTSAASDVTRGSSRLASAFGSASSPTAAGSGAGADGADGAGVISSDPLAIDAFASSGFGAMPDDPPSSRSAIFACCPRCPCCQGCCCCCCCVRRRCYRRRCFLSCARALLTDVLAVGLCVRACV